MSQTTDPPRRSLAELAEVDTTTARFSPAGLLTAYVMPPDASAEYVQQLVRTARINDPVPAAVRASFGRVRTLHVYGLFSYGLFTLADQMAWILPETALGVAFVDHYDGRIPLTRGVEAAVLEATTFHSVVDAFGARGSHPHRRGWRLEGHSDHGSGRFFDASYSSLMRWARSEGLLSDWLAARWEANEEGIKYAVESRVRPPDYAVPDDWSSFNPATRSEWWIGWRKRVWERDERDVLVSLRNLAAHPRPEHTVMPVDSARSLQTVAGFINALWMRGDVPTRDSR